MKAMIFAAGLGTRLKPLTNEKPKALVEVNGKPLLYYAIEIIKKAGIESIIVNTHHFSEQIIAYIENTDFGIPIEISDESEELLNTGGGLKKAAAFLQGNEAFLVYNVDILSDINLTEMLEYHLQTNALATLAVMDRKTARYFLFDDDNTLCGWRNKKDGSERISRMANHVTEYAFSGIQILDPKLLYLMTQEGVFPIVDVYLELAKDYIIKAYNHTNTLWCDLGKHHELECAGEIVSKIFWEIEN